MSEPVHKQVVSLYEHFERFVILLLTAMVAVVVVAAVWSLALDILYGLVLAETFDPTDHTLFQSVFGRIFTVIIALEFERSLLVVAQGTETVVQVRTVILIAILGIVRKFIILDLSTTEASTLMGLSVAVLSLGMVYSLVRYQDRGAGD